jgi:hypothetical protein
MVISGKGEVGVAFHGIWDLTSKYGANSKDFCWGRIWDGGSCLLPLKW